MNKLINNKKKKKTLNFKYKLKHDFVIHTINVSFICVK